MKKIIIIIISILIVISVVVSIFVGTLFANIISVNTVKSSDYKNTKKIKPEDIISCLKENNIINSSDIYKTSWRRSDEGYLRACNLSL